MEAILYYKKKMKAFIKAISYYLPEKVLTNEDLVKEFPEWSVDKIANKIGVNERHVCDVNETAVDLAIKAGEKIFAIPLGPYGRRDLYPVIIDGVDLPTDCLIQVRLGKNILMQVLTAL